MLINCPRCGFQQPQDKYCAQCGVDMESFKPLSPPAWKKILGNPIVQLSLLVLVAGGVGGTLYRQGLRQADQRVVSPRTPLQVSSSSSFTDESAEKMNPSEETDPSAIEANTNAPAAATADAADGTVTAYKVTPPVASGAPAATPAATARSTTPQILVYYAEISQEYLNNLYGSSRNTGQFMDFGEYSAGLLPNISKILSAPQVKVLHKEVRSLESIKALQWFYGIKNLKDLEQEYGLTTALGINEIENKILRGTIEIQRTWREPQGASFEMQKKSFPAEFEIDEESGFFISGLMPRRSYLDNDRELTNIDIFKILSSPQFRSGESNFVIFIDFENGN